ncbi:uncharacterized protein STEHIDRAFT_119510 [Stereum hirsutum FP-91666 SS1]|uniref:uncharacterized protein n=1 Tax=Stereum hirsutum (strain FP-91666) TaxID=721885 RepID=UPI000440F3F5|nr:uncharacterized protein STEHIDRAFT_119510 [Stereum hirsutum FP-91666 SS1]EIM90528.1 hypothetical protein STEHIDRAFT_119510 [Stereum hirsutum FP-91666 SS1]
MPPPYSHIAPVPYTTYYPQYPQQYKPGQVAPQAPPQYYQQYFLAPIPHHMGHPLSQAPAYAQVLNHNGTPPVPTMIAHGQPQDMSHVHHAHANGNPNGNGNVNGHVNNNAEGNVDPNTPSPHPPHALSGHVVYAAPHPQHPAYTHAQALPQAHAHGQPQYYPAVFTPYPQHYGQPYYTHPAHAQMQPRSETHAHGPPQGYTQVPQYAPPAPYAYTHSPIYPSHVTTAKLSPVPVQVQNGAMNGVVERGQMQHGGHGHGAEEGETV